MKPLKLRDKNFGIILKERQKLTKTLGQPSLHFILCCCHLPAPFQFCIIKCFVLTFSPVSDVITVKIKTESVWDATRDTSSGNISGDKRYCPKTKNTQSLPSLSCYCGGACRLLGKVQNYFHDCPWPEQLFVKLLFAFLPRSPLQWDIWSVCLLALLTPRKCLGSLSFIFAMAGKW